MILPGQHSWRPSQQVCLPDQQVCLPGQHYGRLSVCNAYSTGTVIPGAVWVEHGPDCGTDRHQKQLHLLWSVQVIALGLTRVLELLRMCCCMGDRCILTAGVGYA
eukprot:GHUV01049888.1.p2 GENE.GHUV01049888.1~~GHUV01049888.1.p2  ORF type:complete len:105 (-),score=16.82 GHUV01049888.1:120-434(-)